MSSLVLTGDTSGSVTVTVPAVAGSNTATIGAATGTHYPFTAGTAVASTSGTSIDFTSIPSWVKRITVLLNEVSTSGTSNIIIQVGSGSVETTGYTSTTQITVTTATNVTSTTSGFNIIQIQAAANTMSGIATLATLGSNVWAQNGVVKAGTTAISFSAGAKTTSGVIDRVRITTVNGTDTFDAGSINILYE